jgi:hypothetical protein
MLKEDLQHRALLFETLRAEHQMMRSYPKYYGVLRRALG